MTSPVPSLGNIAGIELTFDNLTNDAYASSIQEATHGLSDNELLALDRRISNFAREVLHLSEGESEAAEELIRGRLFDRTTVIRADNLNRESLERESAAARSAPPSHSTGLGSPPSLGNIGGIELTMANLMNPANTSRIQGVTRGFTDEQLLALDRRISSFVRDSFGTRDNWVYEEGERNVRRGLFDRGTGDRVSRLNSESAGNAPAADRPAPPPSELEPPTPSSPSHEESKKKKPPKKQ